MKIALKMKWIASNIKNPLACWTVGVFGDSETEDYIDILVILPLSGIGKPEQEIRTQAIPSLQAGCYDGTLYPSHLVVSPMCINSNYPCMFLL